MKEDHFSAQASQYANIRPTYPTGLFKWISDHTNKHSLALDIATGNGQSCVGLSKYYEQVIGVDTSQEQIKNAYQIDNVKYIVSSAENIDKEITENSVDVITIAQALHFFNLNEFYKCLDKVLKPNGMLIAWVYIFPTCSQSNITDFIANCYYNVLKDHWEPFRTLVNDKYTTINFPYTKIDVPNEHKYVTVHWTKNDLYKYMHTWTAVQKLIKLTHTDSVECFKNELDNLWPSDIEKLDFTFELHFVCGLKPDFHKTYVEDAYNTIAQYFDRTRNYMWPKSEAFLKSISKDATIVDVGCGNGRNMLYLKNRNYTLLKGCDICQSFVDICLKKQLDVIKADNLKLPYNDDMFDCVISIAVVHHFNTKELRQQAIKELVRICKPNGKILIQVWGSNAVGSSIDKKTVIKDNDVLIPWYTVEGTFKTQRYYHLFCLGELESYCENLNVTILESYEEHFNYGTILLKR